MPQSPPPHTGQAARRPTRAPRLASWSRPPIPPRCAIPSNQAWRAGGWLLSRCSTIPPHPYPLPPSPKLVRTHSQIAGRSAGRSAGRTSTPWPPVTAQHDPPTTDSKRRTPPQKLATTACAVCLRQTKNRTKNFGSPCRAKPLQTAHAIFTVLCPAGATIPELLPLKAAPLFSLQVGR